MKTTFKITPVVKWVVTKVVEDEANRSGSATLYGEFPDEATAEQALRAARAAEREPAVSSGAGFSELVRRNREIVDQAYDVLVLKRDPHTLMREYLDAHPGCRAEYTPPPSQT